MHDSILTVIVHGELAMEYMGDILRVKECEAMNLIIICTGEIG